MLHLRLTRIAWGRKYGCPKDHLMGLEDDFSNLEDTAKNAGWDPAWFTKKKVSKKAALAQAVF